MSDKPKLLIIDDEPDICEILVDYLEDDFETTAISNAQAARDFLQNSDFEFILSDLKVPQVSGFELYELAKRCNPSAVFVYVTGHGDHLTPDGVPTLGKPFPGPCELVKWLKSLPKP